jgi:hypothetical protein
METKNVLLGSVCLVVLAAFGCRAGAAGNGTSGSVASKPAESAVHAEEVVDDSMDRLRESVESDIANPDVRAWKVATLKESLERFKVTDKELLQGLDLPELALSSTPTDKLFLHYMAKGYGAMTAIYSNQSGVDTGVQRLLNASGTVHELYMRKDLAEGIVKAFREYDLSPQSTGDADKKKARITLTVLMADTLLTSAQFFPRWKGHERELLAALVERRDRITELEKTYGDYGVGINPPFCLRLAENLDARFAARLRVAPTHEVGGAMFAEEIRRYLSNHP